MRKSILTSIGMLSVTSFCVLGIISCQKENISNDNSTNAGSADPQALIQNVGGAGNASLAACDPSGSCTGAPIVSYNAEISYFPATSASSQTTVNDEVCYIKGISFNPADCNYYIARSNSGTSESYLLRLNSNGTTTALGNFKFGPNLLFINEMEFDQNGDLYILTTSNSLFKAPAANLGNADISVSKIGDFISVSIGTTVTKSLALRSNNDLILTWEVSTNSTNTNVAVISKTTAALGTTTTYTGLSPNSGDFATYSDGTDIYYVKAGSLNKLSGGTVTSVNGSAPTTDVANDATYHPTCIP